MAVRSKPTERTWSVPSRVRLGATLRRARRLPIPGEVLVNVGEAVEPDQVIARALVPSAVWTLSVADSLGADPDEAFQSVIKNLGDRVERGEVIAEREGRIGGRKAFRSPAEGQITAMAHGHVLLEATPTLHELRAGLRGQVADILPGYGAIIEAAGIVIEGIWSSEKDAHGTLTLVEGDRGGRLGAEALVSPYQGALLATPGWPDEGALQLAADLEIAGLIVGSIGPDLLALARSSPFPVLSVEGFGERIMTDPALGLLRDSEGREVYLGGRMGRGPRRTPPQILIERMSARTGDEDLWFRPLIEGARVRVAAGPQLGSVGRVVDATPRRRSVEWATGLVGVEVQLEGGEQIFVPIANLERLG